MDSVFGVIAPEDKKSPSSPRSSTTSWELFSQRRALFQQRFYALREQQQIALEQFEGWRRLSLPLETRMLLLASFQQQCLQVKLDIQQIQSDLRCERLSLARIWQELGWQRDDLKRLRDSQALRMVMH